jgi:hypothetical protein
MRTPKPDRRLSHISSRLPGGAGGSALSRRSVISFLSVIGRVSRLAWATAGLQTRAARTLTSANVCTRL